jgi:hypothetical protein
MTGGGFNQANFNVLLSKYSHAEQLTPTNKTQKTDQSYQPFEKYYKKRPMKRNKSPKLAAPLKSPVNMLKEQSGDSVDQEPANVVLDTETGGFDFDLFSKQLQKHNEGKQ